MTQDTSTRKRHALGLFDGIAADYDRWAQLLSFGHDRALAPTCWSTGWRCGPDSVVADVATGTAAVAMSIAWRHGSRVIGIDQNEAMLARGRERVAATGLDGRIELVQGEAEALPLGDASVDALMHTYLLRYVDDPTGDAARAGPPDPPRRRDGVARVLRAGGRLVSGLVGLDAGRPARRRRGRRPRLVSNRPLPWPQHRAILARSPAGTGAGAGGTRPASRTSARQRLSVGGAVIIRGIKT